METNRFFLGGEGLPPFRPRPPLLLVMRGSAPQTPQMKIPESPHGPAAIRGDPHGGTPKFPSSPRPVKQARGKPSDYISILPGATPQIIMRYRVCTWTTRMGRHKKQSNRLNRHLIKKTMATAKKCNRPNLSYGATSAPQTQILG